MIRPFSLGTRSAAAASLTRRTPLQPCRRVTHAIAGSLVLVQIVLAHAQGAGNSTDVFISGTDGYHTYRIPAIESAPDGSLVAFAEGRKYNDADPGFGKQDIDLVYKRSTNSGATWSPMVVLEDPGEEWSAANPCTVVDQAQGKLWVFYLRSKPGRSTETARPGTDDMQTRARWSADNGRRWSENPVRGLCHFLG